METYFTNVEIAIEAESPEAAYKQLCTALATLKDCEWTTDTYHTGDGNEMPVAQLYPKEAKGH